MTNNNNNEDNSDNTRAAVSPNHRRDLTVAQLRRSSSHVTPTRTLRLSEQEHQQREAEQESNITLERLQARPRSNQRNRTPNRHESPLDPDALRRTTRRIQNVDNDESGPRRITIRPGAGAAVGVVAPMRARDEERVRVVVEETTLSSKQGPSHRKVRRWNNDHLDRLAAEIAPSSQTAANALLKGQEDAHLYRSILYSDPPRSLESGWNRFIQDETLQGVRGRFFEGEGPNPATEDQNRHKKQNSPTTSRDQLQRIDPRVRRVITKACQNSYPACRVVKTFETFVLESFVPVPSTESVLEPDWWKDVLLEQPLVAQGKNGNDWTAQFLFDPTNATGGFHRLLLHAVCQFHKLSAVSRMVSVHPAKKARALTVTGGIVSMDAPVFCLLEVLTGDKDTDNLANGGEVETCRSKIEDTWTVVC